METKTKCANECESGVIYTANGSDDFDTMFCDCEAGKRAEFFSWFAQRKSELAKQMSV